MNLTESTKTVKKPIYVYKAKTRKGQLLAPGTQHQRSSQFATRAPKPNSLNNSARHQTMEILQ